jgi:hypothetical protein
MIVQAASADQADRRITVLLFVAIGLLATVAFFVLGTEIGGVGRSWLVVG